MTVVCQPLLHLFAFELKRSVNQVSLGEKNGTNSL